MTIHFEKKNLNLNYSDGKFILYLENDNDNQ